MARESEILEALRRIEEWMMLSVKVQLSPIAERELSDSKMKELYAMTGDVSTQEIQKKLKLAAKTISDTWKRWEQLGLLIRDGKRYRKVL